MLTKTQNMTNTEALVKLAVSHNSIHYNDDNKEIPHVS